MTATVEQVYSEALALPTEARTKLAEKLIASLGQNIAPEKERAHLNEVRRRIEQVESGEVSMISGKDASAHVRKLLTTPTTRR